MPLRYGVNFPAWFHPQYLPTAPIAPSEPKQIFYVDKEVVVQQISISGQSIPKVIALLSHYNSEEFFISVDNYGSHSVDIMKTEKVEVILDDKEFNKAIKDYNRSIKEYEKKESEYQSRLSKYPGMLYMYEDAKLREILTKAEDELEDAQIRESESQQILAELNKTIDSTKKKLIALKVKNKDV